MDFPDYDSCSDYDDDEEEDEDAEYDRNVSASRGRSIGPYLGAGAIMKIDRVMSES